MGWERPLFLRVVGIVGVVGCLYEELADSVAETARASIEVAANDGGRVLSMRFRKSLNSFEDGFDLGDSGSSRAEVQVEVDYVDAPGTNYEPGIHESLFPQVAIAERSDNAFGYWIL